MTLRRPEMALSRTESDLWFYQVLLVHTSLLSLNFILNFGTIGLFVIFLPSEMISVGFQRPSVAF